MKWLRNLSIICLLFSTLFFSIFLTETGISLQWILLLDTGSATCLVILFRKKIEKARLSGPISCLFILAILLSLIPVTMFFSPDFIPKVYASTTTTIYSSNPDGDLRSSNGVYATARTAATGTVENTSNYIRLGQRFTAGTYFVYHDYLYFDASSLPDTASITSATLGLYGNGTYNSNPTPDFNITIQTGGGTYPHNPLASGDFNMSFYSGDGGQFNTTSWTVNAYNNITMTATGLNWISVTGSTKLCLRSSRDIAGTAPTVGTEYLDFQADESSQSYPAFLEITYTIDPTASGSLNQLRDPYQRKTFYAHSRVWVGFNNDTTTSTASFLITSSTDGTSWTTPLYIGTLAYIMGEHASLYYDPTNDYVHFVWEQYDTHDLYYRRGRPYSNGTLTLSTTQLVYNGSGLFDRLVMPSIAVDTDGYAWLGVQWSYTSGSTMGRIYKDNNNDGTWSTDFYTNLTNTNGTASGPRIVPLPLLNGKMAFLYQVINGYVYLDIWNGTAYSVTGEQASLLIGVHGDFMAGVAVNDDIHMSYHTASPYNISYRMRTWGVGWEASETLVAQNVQSLAGAPMNWAQNDNSIRIFWVNSTSNIVYYRQRYYNGTWASITEWFTSASQLSTERTHQVSYKTQAGENITFVYQIGTTSPYHFRYKNIFIPDTINPTYSNVGVNSTVESSPTQFYSSWEDNTGLHGGIFGYNGSGVWVNDTWSDFWAGSPLTGWSNITKTLPTGEGKVIQWQIWVNDTANNWNDTGLESFVMTGLGYNLSLLIKDWDLADTIESAAVTMNNGSNQIKLSDSSGWANYTGISAASVTVKVSYYGFWVNGTWTQTMDTDYTITVQCKLYDVTITMQEPTNQDLLYLANVTAFNTTSTAPNKIRTGLTTTNGQVTLNNLPNATLTLTQYGAGIMIGNVTKTISADGQTETLTASQNGLEITTAWQVGPVMNTLGIIARRREELK